MASGPNSARSQASVAQLLELERLLLTNNCDALYTYVITNETVLEGNDPLAQALRQFVQQVRFGLSDCITTGSTAASSAFTPSASIY